VKKPTHWYRYIGDTFIIWPHEQETFQDFLQHLNGIHGKFKFTKELEQNGTLPLLDVLVKKKMDGTLGHTVYRKTTNTDVNLQEDLQHHLEQNSHPLCMIYL
jgi:hypothetical protein